MYSIKTEISEAMMSAYIYITIVTGQFMDAAKSKLREKNGSFFTEHGLAIVITVVIAALLMTAIALLFKDKIFPNLDKKVDDFFAIT